MLILHRFNTLEGGTFRTYGAGRYVYRLEITYI